MVKVEVSYEDPPQEENELRRETYRVRRASSASRRRIRKKPAAMPGGIRQRRNKHWNW
jgi:hypothetical protein